MRIRVLFVKPWVEDLGPMLAALREGGFEVTYERVDFAPALSAALHSGVWDLVIFDRNTPDLPLDMIVQTLREQQCRTSIVVIDRTDRLADDVRHAMEG